MSHESVTARFEKKRRGIKLDVPTLNQRVQGSSPCAPTNRINHLRNEEPPTGREIQFPSDQASDLSPRLRGPDHPTAGAIGRQSPNHSPLHMPAPDPFHFELTARPSSACAIGRLSGRQPPRRRQSTIANTSPRVKNRAQSLRQPRPSVDHPTIANVSRDQRSEIAVDPFQILYQKNYALCGNCLHLEFGLIQPLHRLSICSECVASSSNSPSF